MAILERAHPKTRPTLATTSTGASDATLWTQYLNSLLNVAPGADLSGLQAAPMASAIDLADSNQQNVNQAIYSVANPLPGWSALYQPTEVGLFTQYGLFLNGLQLIPQNTSSSLQQQEVQDLENLRTAVSQLQSDLNSNASPVIISADEQAVTAANQAFTETVEQINGPNYAVIGQDLSNYMFALQGVAAGSAGNQLTMPTPAQNGLPIQVPLYSVGSYSQWLATAQANASSNPPVYQQSLTFNTTSVSTYSGAFTSSSAQSETIFFGVYDSGSNSWQQIETSGGQQLSYTVTLNLPGVILLDVTPATWFDGTLLSDFQNGPFQAGSPFVQNPAFGENGIFNLMVQELLVAYSPTVSVQFDEASWSTYYSAWTDSSYSAVSVGPFYGNSSSTSSAGYGATAQYNSETYTMTLSYSGPMLLGIVADVLP